MPGLGVLGRLVWTICFFFFSGFALGMYAYLPIVVHTYEVTSLSFETRGVE